MWRFIFLLLGWLALPVEAEWAPVSHRRELRGAWVASVSHITFPSQPGTDPAAQQAELVHLLDELQKAGFNAVFFQVRPEGDALYRSRLEPWSRFLTGQQGQDPGYDPLLWLTEQAHRRNLEVHAWLNPFRARALPPSESAFVSPHLAAQRPELVVSYGQFFWMDPASPTVRQRLVDVVKDLSSRYAVDGIHFDDYFYPYPEKEADFPDGPSWQAYQAQGGQATRDDWRRAQVNAAVREVWQAVKTNWPWLRFGISPFGIPAPEKPAGIEGMDQYARLYADPQHWMDQGWVDYLAPQLYWPSTQTPQAFEPLLHWWVGRARPGCPIYTGLNLAALGSKPAWTLDEYRLQVQLTRQAGAGGSIWWNPNPLLQGRAGVRELFAELYAQPALPPPLPGAERPLAPAVQRDSQGDLLLTPLDQQPVKSWTVYAWEEGRWSLQQVLPGDQRQLSLPAGRWAVAQVSRYGSESLGTIVRVGSQ
jgi:uncharacterized lipoprotein YddW (UPF0748 family)